MDSHWTCPTNPELDRKESPTSASARPSQPAHESLAAGAEAASDRRGNLRSPAESATHSVGGPGTNRYNSLAQFLLGFTDNMGTALQNYDPMTTREWLIGLYLRDRWAVQPEAYPHPGRALGVLPAHDTRSLRNRALRPG